MSAKKSTAPPGARRRRARAALAGASAVMLGVGLVPAAVVLPSAHAAPVGQGFNLNASDLRFFLKQIKIAERHAATRTPENPCGTLLGDGPDQIPNIGQGVELPWGLRTVDGSCNNLIEDQGNFGTADQRFPRLVEKHLIDAESGDADGPGPSPNGPTSYTQTSGFVIDSRPRVISNLIVDQTPNNPAAVAAAGEDDALTNGAFFIPNVAPDVGLSAPYNSWFTLFGQFFDHGLDLVNKGGNGTVFVPLKQDDPLFDDGADNIPGNADDGPNFMLLSRATQDGAGEQRNQTSPFVDQSQTYTSHPSHQAFLREYAAAPGGPVATGRLITGPGDGMATWADVKAQAAARLGIALTDEDALSVPLLATDPYGRFLRGPSGLPQLVVPSAPNGLVEGNLTTPVTTAGATKSGHAFLDDIAHHAVPGLVDHDNDPATPRQTAVPDADPGTTDDHLPATYDDEMLGAHFMAGDGRVNENIGLTAVHHVFHAEHNRLRAEIDGMITSELSDDEEADWRSTSGPSGWDYGERLFQAARFVTEMEYQHLVFEEFVRKVQPMVNLFGEGGTGYHTTINPAIPAEFAHAVYRFGHSMLTETVARVRPGGARADLPLLDAFLNPPAFLEGSGNNAQVAAGAIVRGMSRQVGNELDEFVTEALRNRLLGLPLDLPVLNMARARDTGIPSLNAARRTFHAQTNNSALTPYESWADFGFALRHPESLVNFIAAYGTHPLIVAAGNTDTPVASRRDVATAIVYGPTGADGVAGGGDDPTTVIDPDEAFNFLNGLTGFENVNGRTTTGVDDIDLWSGGLAEKGMVFGGLLGPTFNYVFETTTEDLQDGDRFYYLSRTAGLNLLTQLEGNSFAELIQRNTDADSLPADSFSRPDFVFDVGAVGGAGPILNDPATEVNETAVLTRRPDGTIRFAGPEHVVFNGTSGNDRVWSSEGDDTIRGNDGDDWMEGGDGADNLVGGVGDDIMNDLFGDDVMKGGDGDDAISSGQGFGGDLNQGGRGKDFIVGGNDITETFGGPGDDFIFAGDAEDTVAGDDGDDWIEGGKGPFNLLQGDNGAPFQDDPNAPGHDVIDGDGGEQDMDSEGGDDIMLMGPGIQRAEGMLGFDWTTHKGDPQPADSDMEFTALVPIAIDTNRDRFDLVEALSGWNRNDVLRGDDRAAADIEPEHVLTAAGIARVAGAQAMLGAGVTSFSSGNILMGGAGNDLIEGRGGDDLIDGDRWVNVQLRAPNVLTADPADTVLVDGMSVDPDGAGPRQSLRADVFAGRIKPGQISIVRSIETSPSADVDTAQFSGPLADYTVTRNGAVTTVSHTGGTGVDGTDRVQNVERLLFTDQTVGIGAPGAPTIGNATAGNGSATVRWTPPSGSIIGVSSYNVRVVTAANPTVQVGVLRPVNNPAATSLVVTGLTNGTGYQFQVQAVNNAFPPAQAGPFSALSNVVTPAPPPATVPNAPTILPAVSGAAGGAVTATVLWIPSTNNGGAAITGYRIIATRIVGGVQQPPVTLAGTFNPATILGFKTQQVTLAAGNYRFQVVAVNSVGDSPSSALSPNTVIAR